MTRKLSLSMLITAASLTGCLGAAPGGGAGSSTGTNGNGAKGGTTTPAPDPGSLGLGPTGSTAGGTTTTFDHPNDGIDPFAVLQRIQQEGPPAISTKMHSCQKVKYATVGNLLSDWGVNMAGTGNTAGGLYAGAGQALGAPNYPARIPEGIALTTAGATSLFDIFVQAAPEIIKAMPTNARCNVAGVATSMFNADGTCAAAGITCLTGTPAAQAQVDLCNSIAGSASSATIGQTIAVASLLSSAHTCE
jgi:hypothetical protein